LPWLGLAALVAGTVCNLPSGSRGGLWLAALTSSGLWLLVPAELRTTPWWSVPVFAAIVIAGWAAADVQASRLPGPAVPFWLALVALAAAVVAIHAGIARFTDVALIQAAGLGGIGLASFWRAGNTGSVAGAACVVVDGLMLASWTEGVSEVPWSSFALVALAPLTLALPLARPGSWMRALVQTTGLWGPLVVAVVLAWGA
jgi:hypothetical protein